MRQPRLVLALALLMTVDLCHPFVGRAFTFNPDESVEVLRGHQGARDAVGGPAVSGNGNPSLGVPPADTAARVRRPLPHRADWLVEPTRARARHAEPPAPPDDH